MDKDKFNRMRGISMAAVNSFNEKNRQPKAVEPVKTSSSEPKTWYDQFNR